MNLAGAILVAAGMLLGLATGHDSRMAGKGKAATGTKTKEAAPSATKGTAMNETLKIIFSRKSVRTFQEGKVVPRETLELIVRAGMAAPSARDRRPWQFVVVTDPLVLKELTDDLPYAKMTAQAGAAIVVLGDLDTQNGGRSSDYWLQDCSAVTQNILLAVESLGLGAVWTAVYPNQDRIVPVRRILGLPDHIMPLNLIPVGFPAGETKPKDKWDASRIRWNGWGEHFQP